MARKRKRRPGGDRDRRGASRSRPRDAATVARSGRSRIDFAAINAAALARLPALAARWLPDGRRQGDEWCARNPRRADRRPGSFLVNLKTGRWADFALPDARGGDPVSLAAYLHGKSQADAARDLAAWLAFAP